MYIKSLYCGQLEEEACNLELYHLKKDPKEPNNLVVSPLLHCTAIALTNDFLPAGARELAVGADPPEGSPDGPAALHGGGRLVLTGLQGEGHGERGPRYGVMPGKLRLDYNMEIDWASKELDPFSSLP